MMSLISITSNFLQGFLHGSRSVHESRKKLHPNKNFPLFLKSVLGLHSSHKYNYITSYIIILKLMKGIYSHKLIKLYGNLSSDYQTFSC